MTFKAFVGDAEHPLRLTPPMILELERLLGTGIAAIFRRVAKGEFTFSDLEQSIRLGLIGGGMAPEKASQLVATYVATRPIAEILPAALGVLSVAWFGADEKKPAKQKETAA
ncbi:MAG TPA: gene transfer agent family protein [Mesorhizobium sp.]|jgi:hypothetical protein|nr:gene transfer agent family protein [Mesorhizobium sp.]